VRVSNSYYEDDATQRMPPPPSRRLMEQPENEIVDYRGYRQRDYSLRPAEAVPVREEFMPPPEMIDRRPASTYQHVATPREYAPRAYSVRPEVVRREVPAETVTRHESIQPGQYVRRVEAPTQAYEEFSARRGDYMPAEERGYSYAPQPQLVRAADEGYAPDRPADAFQDGYVGDARRAGYRY